MVTVAESGPTSSMRGRLARACRAAATAFVAVVAAGLTTTYALMSGLTGAASVPRLIVAATLGIAALVAPFLLGRRRGLTVSVFVAVGTIGYFFALTPSNDRAWWEPQSRVPDVRFEHDLVHVTDIRDFRYHEGSDGVVGWSAAWRNETFDLRQVRRAWFVLTQFSDIDGVGHVMVSFEFEGPRYLVISAEIRREDGENFDPIRGLFRQFEIMYVIADERDVIALRTNVHRDDTWLVPINAGPQKTREFLVDMLQRAAALHDGAEWYNTVSNSCSSNLARHYERINDVSLGFDRRILLPGHSLELIEQLRLLPDGVDLAQAQTRFSINDRALAAPVDDTFSARIRAEMVAPSDEPAAPVD